MNWYPVCIGINGAKHIGSIIQIMKAYDSSSLAFNVGVRDRYIPKHFVAYSSNHKQIINHLGIPEHE